MIPLRTNNLRQVTLRAHSTCPPTYWYSTSLLYVTVYVNINDICVVTLYVKSHILYVVFIYVNALRTSLR